MSVINFPIEHLNRFLSNHSFVVDRPFGDIFNETNNVTVKLKITGLKPMISVGEWKDFIEYTLFLEDIESETYQETLSVLFDTLISNDYKISNTDTTFYLLTSKVNNLLREFLKYWDIDNYVNCNRIINNINTGNSKFMNESLEIGNDYDDIISNVVEDILSVFENQREGEYVLPEDISTNEEDMVYEFPQLGSVFTVNLEMSISDDVDTVDVDGEYYRDEDTLEIRVKTNPNLNGDGIQELSLELNELVAHELEHIIQRDKGYKFPNKEPKLPLKYYTQQHELEAQIAGFKRRAQKEGTSLESVVINWFKRNQIKHRLTPKEMEIVVNQILKLGQS
jgi:hypothetical protein